MEKVFQKKISFHFSLMKEINYFWSQPSFISFFCSFPSEEFYEFCILFKCNALRIILYLIFKKVLVYHNIITVLLLVNTNCIHFHCVQFVHCANVRQSDFWGKNWHILQCAKLLQDPNSNLKCCYLAWRASENFDRYPKMGKTQI